MKKIMSIPTKLCKLDALSTKILKSVLDKYVPIITKIINLSLSEEVSVAKWKTEIVRPLLKKTGLDLVASNYQPVSNLSFLRWLLNNSRITARDIIFFLAINQLIK